jgi:hypothetical protein
MEAYQSSHSTPQKVQVCERRSFDPTKALTVGWLVYVLGLSQSAVYYKVYLPSLGREPSGPHHVSHD